MEQDRNSLDILSAELIRSVGMQETKSILVRVGFELGKSFMPKSASSDRIANWREFVETYLKNQGLSNIEVSIACASKEKNNFSGVTSSIRFQVLENSSSILLRPWIYAGWCSGYSHAQLGRDILYRVEKAPNENSSLCVLQGAEENVWQNTEEELIVDYRCFRKTANETRSLAMRVCLDRLRDIAPSESAVYLQADRLDGPDYLARFIHHHSQRVQKLFIFLEPLALDMNLFENTLLTAAHGTLFISSIEMLPLQSQQRLVRAVDSQSGSLNIRLIVSGERSLSQLLREGLLYPKLVRLLQGHEILVPPLRMRMEDLVPLSRRFLQQLAAKNSSDNLHFSPAVLNEFLHYAWPGGLKELKSVIQTMLERRRESDTTLDVKHLPANFGVTNFYPGNFSLVGTSVADVERRLILSTLQHVRGNKREAAKLLRIGYNTLWRKLGAYEKQEGRDTHTAWAKGKGQGLRHETY